MPALNYAVRLRASYEALATTCGDWSSLCEKMLCYEHPEKNNIHCHFLLVGVRCSTDTLKRAYKSHGLDLKGPGQVMFSTTYQLKDKTKVEITEETIPKYITYMSKGKYDASYNKGYDIEFLNECKAKWIDYKKQTRDEVIYDEFEVYIQGYMLLHGMKVSALTPKELRCLAIKHTVSKFNGIINVQCRKESKMLYDSYAYKHALIGTNSILLPFERW